MNAEKLRAALSAVAKVLARGEATHDRDDWLHRSPLFHVEHAERHCSDSVGASTTADHQRTRPPEF